MTNESRVESRGPRAGGEAYRFAHLVFGGWTHRVGRDGNGAFDLFDQLYRRFACGDSLVAYFPWYLAPQDIAKLIAARNDECLLACGERLKVQIAGYSFGGQTAVNVCRELERIAPEVIVDSLCLSDAVARCGRLGWLRAANPLSTITVPKDNVRLITAFVQRNRRWRLRPPFFFPRGHKLQLDCGLPIEPEVLDCEHTEMDDALEWHDVVLSDAADLHRGGEGDGDGEPRFADILPIRDLHAA